MTDGYTGKILNVDLSSKTTKAEDLDFSQARQFIGGRGLGAKILWDRQKAGTAPLSPESLLLLLTGPLTGVTPMSAFTTVMFKSPMTENTLCHSTIGPHWGPELKFAGFDGIIITGQSPTPVYLKIEDGKAELKDAAHLWGKTTSETELKLKEELKDPRYRVLCIGPAGEKGVRYAGIHAEYFHAAARGGSGTLMGAKKLKAIAVRGRQGIQIARIKEYNDACSPLLGKMIAARKGASRHGYAFARWGSYLSSMSDSDIGELDVKNYREGYWDEVDKTGALTFERKAKVKTRGCYGCPLACMQIGVIREGPYAGYVVNPDFDSTGTIGPGCLVNDLWANMYLERLGEELGFDNITLGNTTGFAMECYEKGILTKKDLGGLDLTWGNVPAMIELWNKILNQEGIGALLAQGVKKASEKIGQGSEKFAMHVKGLEFGAYTGQAHHDRALQYAVGDRGGCHHYGVTMEEQNVRTWVDSLTMCTWSRSYAPPATYLALLNAVTGSDFVPDDWLKGADRMLLLARAYNIREGMVPMRDDVLPERFHSDALTQGSKKGAFYPKDKFLKERAEWYQKRGCDDKGIPTAKHLEELGLGFVVLEMQKVSG